MLFNSHTLGLICRGLQPHGIVASSGGGGGGSGGGERRDVAPPPSSSSTASTGGATPPPSTPNPPPTGAAARPAVDSIDGLGHVPAVDDAGADLLGTDAPLQVAGGGNAPAATGQVVFATNGSAAEAKAIGGEANANALPLDAAGKILVRLY